ncbi:glycosyltransferase family 4 protein [Paenibacillus sp. GYB003]|uniref:glycosyltransferase family 4 protein n=1 Tax=Paenibacillus sp. GYB003 TaxID=2994392 RepID=UPI002F966546
MSRIAYVSTYVPQKCGLATYTYHLRKSVHAGDPKRKDPVVALHDAETDFGGDPLLWPIRRNDPDDYVKMAGKINRSDIGVVSLQHEFGIFGGEAGQFILHLVRNLKKPLVTTFHTVFENPKPPYADIQREIAEKSARIVVMNRMAVSFLNRSFGIPTEKICFIPHGTPEPDADKRQKYRKQLGWHDRKVVMTFGLLSRGKGIELILKALPEIARHVPNVLYAIVGQTHPEVKKHEGERYREQLSGLIRDSGITGHAVMIDKYMEEAELVKHIMACDLYATPYPGMQQITSGTLAYAVGLGRPVLSTPYSYAQDLLSDYRELLIPFEDDRAWAEQIVSLLRNDVLLRDWVKKIEKLGKSMHWPKVGMLHEELFSEVSRLESVTG